MTRHWWAIGLVTLLEARRNRLLWLALAVAAAGIMLAQFLAQVAITETQAIRLTVMAASYRLAAAFVVASFVVASVQREFADKGVELTLSQPVARASFVFGKLAGFALYALGLAFVFSLTLVIGPGAEPARAALWGASLAAELTLVAAMAGFFAFSLSNNTGAMAAVLALYLLGRSIAAMQVIATSPYAGELGMLHAWVNRGADLIALLLPRLDLFTRAEWLTGPLPGAAELGAVFGQAALYTALLTGATLIDFYRREL